MSLHQGRSSQSASTETSLEWEAVARAERDNAINPAHITITFALERVRLVVRQAALATNRALPDISTLAVSPGVCDKCAVLALWYGGTEELCLSCLPGSAVVD
jgi:hypothetical protein